jgi:hypothetical protein
MTVPTSLQRFNPGATLELNLRRNLPLSGKAQDQGTNPLPLFPHLPFLENTFKTPSQTVLFYQDNKIEMMNRDLKYEPTRSGMATLSLGLVASLVHDSTQTEDSILIDLFLP